jgi:tripartite-type tricarboxylate transporter receptor subunit TctC
VKIAVTGVQTCALPIYTLFLITSVNAINATLYNNLNFDLIKDIAPVAAIAQGPGVMVVNPGFPAQSVPEFIAYAKANPGKINMGTAGSGSMLDVYGELFMMIAGVDMVRVPYRGAPPALTDLLGGQVQVVFDTFAGSLPLVRAGKLNALGVTTTTRSASLPDVPPLAESLPGYEASQWYGIAAPKNTPAEVVNTLNKQINACLADPGLKARLADLGSAVLPGSPDNFGKFIDEEMQKWAKVIKFAGIKPD